MSNRLALWMLAAWALSGSGCMLIARGVRNVTDEFCDCLDECRECQEYRTWAKETWERIGRCSRGAVYSKDYACGFEDGFVAHVWRGGNCEPPPLPPPRYRKACYRTPEGYRAIEQWFAGFRHGATVAREQGYRRLVTGPSSLPHPPGPGADGPPPPPPGPVPPLSPTPAAPPSGEQLPPPRAVPAPPAGETPPAPTGPALPAGPESPSDQARTDPNPDPPLVPPPGPGPAAGNLVPVPFEVQSAPEGSEEAETPPVPKDLVPIPFEVQPAPEGGAEADGPTEKREE